MRHRNRSLMEKVCRAAKLLDVAGALDKHPSLPANGVKPAEAGGR